MERSKEKLRLSDSQCCRAFVRRSVPSCKPVCLFRSSAGGHMDISVLSFPTQSLFSFIALSFSALQTLPCSSWQLSFSLSAFSLHPSLPHWAKWKHALRAWGCYSNSPSCVSPSHEQWLLTTGARLRGCVVGTAPWHCAGDSEPHLGLPVSLCNATAATWGCIYTGRDDKVEQIINERTSK